MQEITWERTSDGKAARLDGETPQYILPIPSFIRLAEEKMTSVGLISADFHGISVSFVRRLSVLLDTRTRAEFLGLYMSDEERTDKEASEQVPTLCLRHAVWNKQGDNERFRQAASMKEYVSNEQQLEALIMFLSPEMVPEIVHLEEEAQTIVKRGVPLLATSRSNPSWDSIDFRFHDIVQVRVSYITDVFVSDELEDWSERWYKQCLKVDHSGGILPDNGFRVGYPFSAMDVWKHFPDQSFQQWRDKRHNQQ